MPRNSHVDLLRGIAIMLVLMLHFALAYGIRNSPFEAVLGQALAAAIFYNGNYGVTIFFVVSGYLITSMSIARWNSLGTVGALCAYCPMGERRATCLRLSYGNRAS